MTASKKENFVLNAIVSFDGIEIERDLLCRVYLPPKVADPIELHFFPTQAQADNLRKYLLWQYSASGEATDFSGEVRTRFSSKEVFATHGVETASHGMGVSESKMVGFPVDLTITQLFSSADNNRTSSDVNFWLTPNSLLQPSSIHQQSYTGNVEVKTLWQLALETNPNTTFLFTEHYRYRRNDDGENVSFSELVANITIERPADSPELFQTLYTLDGVLLLASFAARQRSICLGWDASDSVAHVKQFVRNRAIPTNSKSTRRDTLIDKSQVKEFMESAYVAFAKFAPQDPLRRALSMCVPFPDDTVDGEFVTLYTALEIMVLQFRRQSNLEFILPTDEWKKVRKELKAFLERMSFSPHKKPLIQNKLSELNRVSFGAAFEAFCKHYSVDLSDLWPVVNSASGASLSHVRNKLVHGEHFGPDHYEALALAEQHLRWTVERMILAILNWDIERSRVSPLYLSGWIAYKEWQTKQPALS